MGFVPPKKISPGGRAWKCRFFISISTCNASDSGAARNFFRRD